MRRAELPALTGIRFYAALFVFLSHVVLLPGMEELSGGRLIFNAGVVGVSFFFVLSGFILTYNYSDVFCDGLTVPTYGRFVWDRLAKIYPVHFLAFLIVLPIQIFSPHLPLDWRAVPFHLTLLQCWWPFSTPQFFDTLNVPSWSISCEWFFYLLAPAAMFCVLNKRLRWITVALAGGYACVLAVSLWHNPSDYAHLYFVSWFAPSRFLEFLIGIFVALLFMRRPTRRPVIMAVAMQIVGVVLIIAGAIYRAHAPWPLWGGLLYVPGAILLILGLAHNEGLFVTHLSQPWLNRLGTASFSLYLVHAPLLRAVKGVWLHFGWAVHSWWAFGMVLIIMFLFVQSAALFLCYKYEIPLQKYLRGLIPGVKSTSAPSVVLRTVGDRELPDATPETG